MTEYERGFIDGVKSKVTAELTPVITKIAGGLNQTIQEAVKTVIGNVKITAHEPANEQMIELREAKRLLKLAVEDLHYLECHTVDEEGSCIISNKGEKINCFECPFNNNGRVDEKCIWNHEAEAEKLLKQ